MLSISTYRFSLEGKHPGMIQHSPAGMDAANPGVVELRKLAKKTASKRTDGEIHRIGELETILSIYWSGDRPTLPEANVRACIEKAARTLKDGPRVRRGLIVQSVSFESKDYPEDATKEEIVACTRFVVPVKVGRSSVMRTRALFKDWRATVTVEVLDEMVDQQALRQWLNIGGRMIGIGDWRPDNSGSYGRFTTGEIVKE